jgi:HEAT repeat protein
MARDREEAAAALLAAMRDRRPAVRKEILAAIDRAGFVGGVETPPKVMDAFFAALRDKDRSVRSDAVSRMGNLRGSPAVVPHLLAALSSGDPDVRAAAARVFYRTPDLAHANLSRFRKMARGDRDETVRAVAAGVVKAAESWAKLERAKDPNAPETPPDPETAREITLAKRDLRRPGNPAALAAACRYVARMGAEAAAELAPLVVPLLAHPDASVARESQLALQAMGPEAIPALLVGVKSKDSKIRGHSRSLIEMVQSLGVLAKTDVFIAALTDKDPAVRALAAKVLRSGEREKAVPALAAAASDPAGSVRLAAVTSFFYMQPLPAEFAAAAAPALVKALDDPVPQVRGYAALALGRSDAATPADLVAKIKALAEKDPDGWVRESASQAVYRIRAVSIELEKKQKKS